MREMKDSGVEWIGEMPSIWVTKKLKYLCSYKTGGTPPEKRGISLEDSIPWITPKDLSDNFYITNSEQYISSEMVRKCGYCLFPQGSTLLVCIASIGKIGLATKDCLSNQQITALIPKNSIHPLFLSLAMRSAEQQLIFDASCNVVPILNNKYLSQFPIPVPPYAAQTCIASFLDAKCAEIDALSADIQKEIETLQEYRKSVITEAVTKGLDPNVEMKDSGIEWFDEMPLSWESTRIGYECWIRARLGWKGLKADEYVDEGYPFLSAFNISGNKLVWDSLNYISEERYFESPEIMLKEGDIILVKDGAGIGKCARIDSLPHGPSTTNGSLAVITTHSKLDFRYLHYYLQSSIYQNYIIRMMNGMGVPHLSQEELRKMIIPCPSISEQKHIADYLDAKCAEIDSIIVDKQKQLETLAEYRKSLIYEYVTGKKEVPTA